MSRVLVVDDNVLNLALARETLEDDGYEVAVAQTGAEAIAAFDAVAPDCVVLDVRMPGMDGLDLCARLRQRETGPRTPILFFTALRDAETVDEALRAGGDGLLTKPMRMAEFLDRIEAAVRTREHARG